MSLPTPRVKVYRLSDEGDWLDKGTGHISLEYMEVWQSEGHGAQLPTAFACAHACNNPTRVRLDRHTHAARSMVNGVQTGAQLLPLLLLCAQQSDAMGLLILAEDNQKTLLVHKIRPEDQMYQRAEGEAAVHASLLTANASMCARACLCTQHYVRMHGLAGGMHARVTHT